LSAKNRQLLRTNRQLLRGSRQPFRTNRPDSERRADYSDVATATPDVATATPHVPAVSSCIPRHGFDDACSVLCIAPGIPIDATTIPYVHAIIPTNPRTIPRVETGTSLAPGRARGMPAALPFGASPVRNE